jgi:predicted adenylyl cyclase CyaB
MNRNVELKAKVEALEPIEALLRPRCGEPRLLVQRDTFFGCPAGRMKLREEGSAAELIFYSRSSAAGVRESRYWRAAVADAAAMTALLGAGYGVEGVVQKRRLLFLVGQTRVHLDEVEGLGAFVELEVVLRPEQSVAEGERVAGELMAELGIPASALVGPAYVELLRRG